MSVLFSVPAVSNYLMSVSVSVCVFRLFFLKGWLFGAIRVVVNAGIA